MLQKTICGNDGKVSSPVLVIRKQSVRAFPPVYHLNPQIRRQANSTNCLRLTYASTQAPIVKAQAISLAKSESMINQSICKTTVNAVMLKAMII